jgi:hypothetical protein
LVARETEARLVMCHEKEFVFEVPSVSTLFQDTVQAFLAAKSELPVTPYWEIYTEPKWAFGVPDFHEKEPEA